MHILSKIRDNTINSPVFISVAIAILFGNICGYLATRHDDNREPLPCTAELLKTTVC